MSELTLITSENLNNIDNSKIFIFSGYYGKEKRYDFICNLYNDSKIDDNEKERGILKVLIENKFSIDPQQENDEPLYRYDFYYQKMDNNILESKKKWLPIPKDGGGAKPNHRVTKRKYKKH